MDYLILALLVIVISFSFVVFFGAPYVPTLKPQRQQALKMLNLKEGQLLVELGCGDGSILVLASSRGIKCIGYELNPILVLIAKFRTRHYRSLVKIKWGSLWKADISSADGIYIFLIDKLMLKLERKIINEGKDGLKILSYTFKFPNLPPKQSKQALILYQLSISRQKTHN